MCARPAWRQQAPRVRSRRGDERTRVLENDGLMRLVPHRRELDVGGDLAIHGRRGRLEAGPILRCRPPEETLQEPHDAMLPQPCVYVARVLLIHLLYVSVHAAI